MDWLDTVFLENTLRNWLIASGTLVVSFVVLQVGLRLIVRRLSIAALTTSTEVDDFIVDLLGRTRFFFSLALAVSLATTFLTLSDQAHQWIRAVVVVVVLLQAGLWGMSVIEYLFKRTVVEAAVDGEDRVTDKITLNAIGLVARIVLWSVIALLILENMTGIEVGTLIASLGIGGIAVALAVQNILGDLFSALTITLDKPFVIGDLINVDEFTGEIEHVGLKSTRVRSMTGEQLVFANSDLLNSRIRNYKRMQRRRVVLNLGVTYQTPAAQLAAIPSLLREIIENQEKVTFDRAHLNSLGDSAILFEVVYYIDEPSMQLYMDAQQAINLKIFERFENEGIEFAYPTQTLFVVKEA